ncbi:MAG: LUD domain-containing protein [Thermoleophilia bacterium]
MEKRLVEMFAARLAAAGGGMRICDSRLLLDTLVETVGPDSPVVLTPELSWLAEELQDRGIPAVVGSRAAVAASGFDGGLEDLFRRAGIGITTCLTAVADSGSIVVGPGGGNGGLIAALSPRHVGILRAVDLREGLAEAVALVNGRFGELGGECVFITGPSRTADIEMMSVVGVHGPLALEVIVLEEET